MADPCVYGHIVHISPERLCDRITHLEDAIVQYRKQLSYFTDEEIRAARERYIAPPKTAST